MKTSNKIVNIICGILGCITLIIVIMGLTTTNVKTPIGTSTQIYENEDGVTVDVIESLADELTGTVTFQLTKDGQSKLVDAEGEIEHKGDLDNDIESITKQKMKVTIKYNFILKWQQTYTTTIYTVTHKDNKVFDNVTDLITE